MLLDLHALVAKYDMRITGILHVGAHEAEEAPLYRSVAPNARVVWVEANPDLVVRMQAIGVPDVYQGLASDRDGEQVDFILTNNMQSSSMLELAEHKREHPDVFEVARIPLTTISLNSLLNRVAPEFKFNFIALDIQGAELLALRGLGDERLAEVDFVYSEVNERELYKGCAMISDIDAFLMARGFSRLETAMTRHAWGDAFWRRDA
jgi:FkbM family methyltransferase